MTQRPKRRPATPVPQTREARQRADHARMLAYIRAVREEEELRAEADWALAKALANEPMRPGSALCGDRAVDAIRELLEGGGDDVATRLGEPSPTLTRGTDPRDIGR